MYAVLLTALFAIDDKPTTPPGTGDKPAMNASIDGDWTVVCIEKNGQPVPDAKNVTVHVRNNVVTYTCPAGTDEKHKMKSMRIDFAPGGKIRVTEANADGKFEETGTTRPATAAPTGSNSHVAKSGVYVLTHDYFAICVHDSQPGTGVRPVGGTEQPGGTVAPAGGARATDVGSPSAKSHCTVILKRADGARPGTSPRNP